MCCTIGTSPTDGYISKFEDWKLSERQHEFSRVVEIRGSVLNKKFETQANSEELAALARRFEINRIEKLNLDYLITEKHDILGAYTLIASIKSKVVKFVIEGKEETLDIDEKFDVVLVTEDMAKNNYEELQEFDIEVFNEDKKVDIGEIASQYLSLCIFM